ncbi:hypothetical protein ARMGADRAFT_1128774 [Armillaria gallica]|uniref:DNA-directed RNA polymerase II subunit RPB9-like zinc ribbon domain-containing protein n=1 Tax=Armillaria gallica TaxID=47427 RepID=A0A2H3CVC6_ARMGA|nr:hypothetical protein ARMGADRAFT_1128774 [Armillaria gallica]
MMLFCPSYTNILIIGDADGKNKWICQTCSYQFPITKKHTSRTLLNSEKVDDMRDVSSELSSGARTTYTCIHSMFGYTLLQSASNPFCG